MENVNIMVQELDLKLQQNLFVDVGKILLLIEQVKQKAERYQLKVDVNSVEDYLKNNQNDENNQQSKELDTNRLLYCHLP